MSTSKFPLTYTVRYDAGIDWRSVEVGVIGERNESTTSRSLEESAFIDGAGMW